MIKKTNSKEEPDQAVTSLIMKKFVSEEENKTQASYDIEDISRKNKTKFHTPANLLKSSLLSTGHNKITEVEDESVSNKSNQGTTPDISSPNDSSLNKVIQVATRIMVKSYSSTKPPLGISSRKQSFKLVAIKDSKRSNRDNSGSKLSGKKSSSSLDKHSETGDQSCKARASKNLKHFKK